MREIDNKYKQIKDRLNDIKDTELQDDLLGAVDEMYIIYEKSNNLKYILKNLGLGYCYDGYDIFYLEELKKDLIDKYENEKTKEILDDITSIRDLIEQHN